MSDLRVASCFLLGISLAVTASCAPAEEAPPPPAPIGGFTGNGGSSGSTAGGSSGADTGGAGGMSGGGGSAGASSCAEACPMGGFCMAGGCKCPSDKTDICEATCVSLQANPAHCGVCGTACEAGAAC